MFYARKRSAFMTIGVNPQAPAKRSTVMRKVQQHMATGEGDLRYGKRSRGAVDPNGRGAEEGFVNCVSILWGAVVV